MERVLVGAEVQSAAHQLEAYTLMVGQGFHDVSDAAMLFEQNDKLSSKAWDSEKCATTVFMKIDSSMNFAREVILREASVVSEKTETLSEPLFDENLINSQIEALKEECERIERSIQWVKNLYMFAGPPVKNLITIYEQALEETKKIIQLLMMVLLAHVRNMH